MPQVKVSNEAAREGYEAMKKLAALGHYSQLMADDASFVRKYMEELRVASLGVPCPVCAASQPGGNV